MLTLPSLVTTKAPDAVISSTCGARSALLSPRSREGHRMKLSRPWGRSAWVAPSAWMPQTQGSGCLLVHHYSTDVLFVKGSLLLTHGVCDGAQGEREQEND